MNLRDIMGTVNKGLQVIEALSAAGQEIAPAVSAMKDLVTHTQNGTATTQTLADVEKRLDDMLADFNEPLSDA